MKRILFLVFSLLAACGQVSSSEPAITIEDIPYVMALDPGATEPTIDIYRPEGSGPFPVLVIMHGAGQSTKGAYARFSQALADEGFLVFTPDLSSARGSSGSSLLSDLGIGMREDLEKHYCAAIYAATHATDYGGRAEDLIVFGVSGGGHGGFWISLLEDQVEDVWNQFADRHGGPTQQIECLADGALDVAVYIGFNSAMAYFDVITESHEDTDLIAFLSPKSHFGGNPDMVIRLVAGSRDTILPDAVRAANQEWLQELSSLGYAVGSTEIDAGHDISLSIIAELVAIIQVVEEEASSTR